MALNGARSGSPRASAAAAGAPDAAVIWHDLECGSYTADLALWHELASSAAAGRAEARVLEVGAGTGRVARSLARAGHAVSAVDNDARLLRALRERAGADVVTRCADARRFSLPRRDFELCIVPMQTVQLLGGARGRAAFLRCALAHLAAGGRLALSIITAFEPFDCEAGDAEPAGERARHGGLAYVSRARRVRSRARSTLIEREREVWGSAGKALLSRERYCVALDNLTAEQLEREATAAGFTVAPRRAVAETAEHVGSEVVVVSA